MTDPLKKLLEENTFLSKDALALVKYGCDANTQNSRGESLIYRLITMYASEPIISTLVREYKADINLKNAQGKTPLQAYMEQQGWYPYNVLFLLELGADPNIQDSHGQTLLHRLVMDINAESELRREVITKLVREYNVSINSENSQKQTVFQILLDQNWYVSDILFLLELGANPKTQDSQGQTFIHRLVMDSDPNINSEYRQLITKLVREYNVSIDSENSQKQTALQILLDQKVWYTADILFLLELGANPKTQDSQQQPLLHKLVAYDAGKIEDHNAQAIKMLVDKYGVNIEDKNGQGKTALQCLMEQPKGFRAQDALLLVNLGANPNTTNSRGDSLLHLLATDTADNSGIIEALLQVHVAKVSTNPQGKTPFEAALFAVKYNNGNIANANTLIDYDDKFRNEVRATFEKGNEKSLPRLNALISTLHLKSGKQSFELQGKIRQMAFEAFKETIKDLSPKEQREKLQWVRTQPIFYMHRSTSFFYSLGRTNTVIQIDKMIDALKVENPEEEQGCGFFRFI